MATTTLTGNTTAAPILRQTQTNRDVANFTVCENRRRRDVSAPTGWADDRPLFIRVTCWGDLAVHVAASLGKGDRVTVSGELVPESYEKDGETRHSIALTADEVALSLRFSGASRTPAVAEALAPAF